MFVVPSSSIQTTTHESHVAGGSNEFKQGFFSTHHWSQKVASSWLRSRDAGLVGRLTVGDVENKSREGNGKWRKQTMHISHKPTHKHRIKSSRWCGSTHYKTTLHVQSAHTQGSHVKCMKRTTKLARKYEQSPTYFSTLPHVLEKEGAAGPCRQSPFLSFPVVVGV